MSTNPRRIITIENTSIRDVVNLQIESLEKQYIAMKQVLEYYAVGNEWDYGMKAREILAKYGEEK